MNPLWKTFNPLVMSHQNYPPGVTPWKIDRFENAHENFVQRLDKDQSFDVHARIPEWEGLSAMEQYQKCTQNLQWIISRCLDKELSLRAMGSGWSLSKCAVSDDALINTKRLRHKFRLEAAHFQSSFLAQGHLPENYRFLQCGNTIIQINRHLEEQSQPPKSLMVSGGSNGQTIVGAFSTNTHGSALFAGALPEMIRGLHIVTGPDSHVYLERSSQRLTSPAFHAELGAEVICDDDLFNAALVSFGSFGIVHGVLVEVEDKFLLEQKLRRVAYNASLNAAVTRGDFSGVTEFLKYPLNDPAHPLYHFELAVNLHDFEFDSVEKGVYLRIMHKVPYRDDYHRATPVEGGFTYGDDTLGLIQTVLDKVESTAGFLNRALIPRIVNSLFEMAYDRPEDAVGTIGETFKNTVFRGKAFSAAFGFDRKHTRRVLEICQEVNRRKKLAGALGLRFVKGTAATLGFTRWPVTCVMELDGADARVNHRFTRLLTRQLEQEGIAYTMHWGKISPVWDARRIEQMYGRKQVKAWKQQRSRLLRPEVQELFNNDFLERCGLDDFVPASEGVLEL